MTKYNNIVVFGCKSTTLFLLRALSASGIQISHLITISAEAGLKNEVADYYDLRAEAGQMGIQVYIAQKYSLKDESDRSFINGLGIDIAFVIGWQRLIPAEILSGMAVGAFGMHGSAMNLPLGRGRSPMNWSILEGRQVFYTNLFKYNPGVDEGDVVDTFKFQITGRDTGETMHYKNLLAMKHLITRNIGALQAGTFALRSQPVGITPTYYPKRSPDDGLIDWQQDLVAIERFIRAVTRPFSGAFTFIDTDRVTIWDAQLFDVEDFGYTEAQPATVVAVFPGGKFLVMCYGGLLLVNEYVSGTMVREGMQFTNGGKELKKFERNRHGFFDLES
jgi:methionyl-tRNA formyltransferase